MQYDADGNLVALVDAVNISQTWAYDAAGHVTAATDKNQHATSYSYDDSGNLESVRDRNGQTTTYTYTPDGQVGSITTPRGVTTVAYDGLGRPTSMTNPTATVRLGWSVAGRLVSEATHYEGIAVPDQLVDYTTTPAGRVVSISGQGSTTGYTWDPQGRLAGVNDTVAGAFGFTYDAASGNLASMTRPNHITDQFAFDPNGRLTARDAVNESGTTVDQADYTYDDAGLRDTLTDLAGVHDYSYDPDGHLTGVDNAEGGAPDEAYTYDASGNLTSWPNNPTAQVKHKTADQLTQDAMSTYSYDAEGNQTQAKNRSTGKTTKYTWNAAHQLIKITNPDGTTTSYGYGPLGRRLTATDSVTGNKVFVWAGANLRATLDTTGALFNRNITTPELNGTLAVTTPDGTSYPLKDGLGSTTATTNTTGTVTSTTSYTAYGVASTTGNDGGIDTVAGYTGHQTDPTGLIYARARYYNPTTSTFLSEDPIPSVNAYTCGAGSPTNFLDPTGEIMIGEAFLSSRAVQGAQGVASLLNLMGVGALADSTEPPKLACAVHGVVAAASLGIAYYGSLNPASGGALGLAIGFGLTGEILDATSAGTNPNAVLLSAGLTSLGILQGFLGFSETKPKNPEVRFTLGATAILGTALAAEQAIQATTCLAR